ncbi:MAG TPA: S9 family peptidase [Gemmataceae bacterium]|nr:S9 family peptidase [Gemmataceae bacterium]
MRSVFDLLTCFLILVVPMSSEAANKRAMTIDDLLRFKRISDPCISPDGKWVAYVVTTITNPAENKSSANLWIAATDGQSPPRQLTTTEKKDRHPRWSPDGKQILFESNRSGKNQIWLIDVHGGEARQLTNLSTEAGTAIWSRDGSHIAFVSAVYPEFSEKPFKESDELNKKKMDEIEKNPVKAKTFKRLFYRHWDSYVEDKRQHLFVLQVNDAKGGEAHAAADISKWEPRDVTPGDRDAYPTSTTFSIGDDFCFSPDGKYLVFTAVPAQGEAWSTNHDICRVSIHNKLPQWESLTTNPAADASPQFSPDGKKLAYRAQKKPGYEADKWNLVVVDCDESGAFKGEPKSVTATIDRSVGEFIWTKHNDGAWLLFVADNRGSSSPYSVHFNGQDWSEVEEPGPNAVRGNFTSLSSSITGEEWAAGVSYLSKPAQVAVGKSPQEILNLNLSHANDDLLAELDMQQPESVEIPVEGDAKMQMWIIKPPGFDPKKKWPVAFLVHGGPQGAWEDGWSFRWNAQLWAHQGYVVALPNPRGSTGFGQKFTDEITGDWGGKCYRDLMKAADYVVKLPYVDPSRIGAAGASFGGYMVNWFAVNTGRFQCLIGHCGVWDFDSMYGTTDEIWFDEYEHGGPPWGGHRDSYEKHSPVRLAANLGKFKTPMLIFQNDLDFRCPIGQGHELFTALQRQGVTSKFINFPDEGHWVLKPANSKFWHQEVFAWLKKYVPPGGK